MASVVVVAEASVLEAVVVAFGGADDVLSVLPQAVMLIIVALIIKAAIVLVISVLFIVESSFCFSCYHYIIYSFHDNLFLLQISLLIIFMFLLTEQLPFFLSSAYPISL